MPSSFDGGGADRPHERYRRQHDGTGDGFTGEWASSTGGGWSWLSDDNYPLQIQVLTT